MCSPQKDRLQKCMWVLSENEFRDKFSASLTLDERKSNLYIIASFYCPDSHTKEIV